MKKQTKNRKKITKHSPAHHAMARLFSTAPHAHTGKTIHHRHTSHGALLIALFFTGILLFSNLGVIRAYALSSSGSRTISVNVAGDPPTIGADIIFPTTNSSTEASQIQVTGTCAPNMLVATYINGNFAGSSMCTGGGDYATVIQLIIGSNILQSQNYDGLNQPGPVTAQVTITRQAVPLPTFPGPTGPLPGGTGIAPSSPSSPSSPTPPTSPVSSPVIARTPADITPNFAPAAIVALAKPAPQPEENPCFSTSKQDKLSPNSPTIIPQCIYRSVLVGETLSLPIRILGGTGLYALSIDWGDKLTDIKRVVDTEYHTYQHAYQSSGIVNVELQTTDSDGIGSFLQTVVQVNGGGAASPIASAQSFANISAGLGSLWTQAPVALYWSAVTLVLGFWVGDILQRMHFPGKNSGKKISGKHRPRHA